MYDRWITIFIKKRFYRMRAERIEWFSNRDPFRPEINELLDIGVFLPLEQKDKNGCQIFIIRTAAHSPKKHSQNDVLKVSKQSKEKKNVKKKKLSKFVGKQNDFRLNVAFR